MWLPLGLLGDPALVDDVVGTFLVAVLQELVRCVIIGWRMLPLELEGVRIGDDAGSV